MPMQYTPYCDMTLWPYPDPVRICEDANIEALTFAFLVSTPDGKSLCWGGQDSLPVDWAQPKAQGMHNYGFVVDVSIGGATGTDIAASGDADLAAQAYVDVIKTLRPDTLDFDIEGAAVADTLQHTCRLDALLQARETLGEDFPPWSMTLPVMPDGLTQDGLELISMAKRHPVGAPDEVRIMLMDYGPSYTAMAINNIKACKAASEQLGHPVTAIPMIGQNDVAQEVFTLEGAEIFAEWARHQPDCISKMSCWSINRDRRCGEANASPNCSGVDQQPFDFSSILGGS